MKMNRLAAVVLLSALLLSLVGCLAEKRIGAEHYDKSYYINKYGGDLDSNLSVFPDGLEAGRIVRFESSLGEGLFDTDGYILLEYRCDAQQLTAEEQRLEQISFTIRNTDGQTFTNRVLYDETSYRYPAYITNDGFDSTYEYALIDREGGRIVCVYAAYVLPDGFRYKDCLKNDLSAYKKNSLKAFTVYNHSFDGGQSWTEFDDAIN